MKTLAATLATGFVLLYFSELLFWARLRPDDSLPSWFSTWIAYSLIAFLFLAAIDYFRVRSHWSLFLAGALAGWLAEGVIVQTMVEMLPLSISFTGLAWHALISVWVGWYALRRALLTGWSATVRLASIIGIGYGFWAICWWSEPDGGIMAPAGFGFYSLVATLLLIGACRLLDWALSAPFSWGRIPLLLVGPLFALWFALVAAPAAPAVVAVLPPLLLALWWGLERNRRCEARDSLLVALRGPVPMMRLTGLLALPAAATLVYAVAHVLQWRLPTNWLLYLVTTPAGFVLLALAFRQIWHMKTPVHEQPGTVEPNG
jgi:hypothetical protein